MPQESSQKTNTMPTSDKLGEDILESFRKVEPDPAIFPNRDYQKEWEEATKEWHEIPRCARNDNQMSKNIIILGAGFGGLRTAIELAKRKDKLEDFNIILIDKNLHHTFTPLLYEVATGYFEHESWRSELALTRGAEITIPKIVEIACHDCVDFMVGEVARVDLANRKALMRDGKALDYEYLVLGPGAQSDYFEIEGLREYSIALKDIASAIAIRRQLQKFIKEKSEGYGVQLRILVGGGGSTGVEFASELAYYLRHVARKRALRPGDYEIILIEAGSRLISYAPLGASKLAYNRLTRLGVKVLLDTCIKKVINGELVVTPRPLKPGENSDILLCSLAPGKEKKFNYDILVWAGGIRGNSLLASSGFQVDAKGRVVIDEYCQVKNMKKVFALGDSATYTDPTSSQTVPALGQTAIEQGRVLAGKILNEILGEPARAYKLHPYPTVLPMGAKYALFIYKNFYMVGVSGWLLHQLAWLRYFIGILRLKEGLKLWFRGAWVYSKND